VALDEVLQDADLVGEVGFGDRRLRDDVDVEAVLLALLRGLLQVLGDRVVDENCDGWRPGDRELGLALALRLDPLQRAA